MEYKARKIRRGEREKIQRKLERDKVKWKIRIKWNIKRKIRSGGREKIQRKLERDKVKW